MDVCRNAFILIWANIKYQLLKNSNTKKRMLPCEYQIQVSDQMGHSRSLNQLVVGGEFPNLSSSNCGASTVISANDFSNYSFID